MNKFFFKSCIRSPRTQLKTALKNLEWAVRFAILQDTLNGRGHFDPLNSTPFKNDVIIPNVNLVSISVALKVVDSLTIVAFTLI